MSQIGPGPVEHRHKVIADDLDPTSGQHADVFLIIFNQSIAGIITTFDILVDPKAVHDLRS